ncbi:HAMP domain-containing histidine kinase [Eubacteriales bacterium OttesenSCG-928-N14]|nr:HAMP domain-containing histidine kinase [Eubacteriales bacterium OttesenSCG-928-N14]
MKFSLKVFLTTIAIIATALSLGGFLLVNKNYNDSIEMERQRAIGQHQLLALNISTNLSNLGEDDYRNLSREMMDKWGQSLASATANNSYIALHYAPKNGEMVSAFSSFPGRFNVYAENAPLFDLPQDQINYTVMDFNGRTHIIVTNKLNEAFILYDEDSGIYTDQRQYLYLSSSQEITPLLDSLQAQMNSYILIELITLAVSALLMFLVSHWLTAPIMQLTRTSRRIAAGAYDERVDITSTDEIGDLAKSFNRMADSVNEKMQELELNAQQKEDFVANFAHELKTPLTSVIGYADMLRKQKLDAKNTHMAASYIHSEGRRLEALSLKLMEMIVLDKQDFALSPISAQRLLNNIAGVVQPLMQRRECELQLSIEPCDVMVEPDLVKTMIINLIDNAAKAEASVIVLEGFIDGNGYVVGVTDNGRGMKEEDLSRITEAFYMVDKSRSRKQHGAGLGLSIAQRIAAMHGTQLQFRSELGVGTSVSLVLPIAKGVGA